MPTSKQRNLTRAAVRLYSANVAEAEAYLASRAITPAMARSWQLGVVREPAQGHESYVGRLAIPYLTPAGPVGIVFRCLRDHDCKASKCPKYLAEEGRYRGLYNVHAFAKPLSKIYITEGELDAVVATANGYPAVAIPGAARWEPHWSYLWDGYEQVIVLADGDTAGAALASKIKHEVRQATVVHLPQGHDCSSLVTEQGAEALHTLLAEGRS